MIKKVVYNGYDQIHDHEMKSTDEINQAVLELWRITASDKRGDLLPLLLSPIEKGALLFVGFNPSFTANKESNDPEVNKKYLDSQETYQYREIVSQDISTILADGKESLEKYPYFKKMHEITQEIHQAYRHIPSKLQHLDLFFIRDTNQKKAEKLLLNEGGNGDRFTPFGRAQFDLFIAALRLAEPACVVVSNARSSHLLRAELGLKKVGSPALYYKSDEFEIPFHLGSMISGQRAMDIFSVDRLKYAIHSSLGKA